jgi:hypothetical protein
MRREICSRIKKPLKNNLEGCQLHKNRRFQALIARLNLTFKIGMLFAVLLLTPNAEKKI